MGQHAWVGYLELPEIEPLLWQSVEPLKAAWKRDQKHPKAYPADTSYVLAEIQQRVTRRMGVRSPGRFLSLKIPKTLSELVSEGTIKSIWEENHNGSFEEAIARAAASDYKNPNKSWKVFQGIIRAMETAYLVEYWGLEFMGMPKVNILHKGLDEIAAAGIGDQMERGFAEFLDDLCPCGLKKHREAVRKLASRSARMRRPKE